MHHDAFGEISYQEDEQAWLGSCALPTFAEYGRDSENAVLPELDDNFRKGLFPLTIQDDMGSGPSSQQANTFRFLRQNETDVCRAVMAELLTCLTESLGSQRTGGILGWLQRRFGYELKTLEDLRPNVRCIGVEFSSSFVGEYAYVAFYFETIWGWENEHGLSVVFHPEKGTFWGDGSALQYIEEADNLNEE